MKNRAVATIGAIAVASSCAGGSGSPSSIDCDESSGRTEEVDIEDLAALVHLPPCYDSSSGRYPAVFLLHGAGMSPESWVNPEIGADVTADRMMVDGEISPVVLVFAPRSTAPRGFVDRVIAPLFETLGREYRVLDSPESRGIGGFSAAGPATAVSALSGPQRFGAVGFFAVTWSETVGETMLESMADRSDRPAVRIDIGDRDNLRGNVERIERDLAAFDLIPEVTIVPGGHDLDFVADRLDDWLVWFDEQRR